MFKTRFFQFVKKYKFLPISFAIVSCVAFFFGSASNAYASPEVVSAGGPATGWYTAIQATTSVEYEINEFVVYKACNTDSSAGHVWLNVTTSGTYSAADIIATSTIYNVLSLQNVAPNYTTCSLAKTFSFYPSLTLSPGTTYYFWLTQSGSNGFYTIKDDSNGIQYNKRFNNGASASPSLVALPKMVGAEYDFNENLDPIIIELPENDINVYVYDETNPLVFSKYNDCDLSHTCYLKFKVFPDQNQGNWIYAYYNGSYDVIASTTILSGYTSNNWEYQYLTIPTATSTGQKEYWFRIDQAPSGLGSEDVSYTGIYINWKNDDIATTWLSNECQRIASSTDIDCDESLSWVSCGLKKIFNWLLAVKSSDCDRINQSSYLLRDSFPTSVLYSVANTMSEATDNATTSEIVIAPLKWYDKDTGDYEETGANLLSNKTFENGMGSELYAFYYLWFARFIWLAVAGYVVFRIMRILNKNWETNIRRPYSRKSDYPRKEIKPGNQYD